MLKNFFVFCLLSTVFCLLTPTTYAADPKFDISVDSSYNIHENGLTDVSQKITIQNKTDYYYTPTYTVSVGFKDIQNIEAFNSDGSIPTTLDDKKPDNKRIKMSFPKRYAGIAENNQFTLRFSTKDIAQKQGTIWEVIIPGIESPDDFKDYKTTITVPDSFGKARIVKPEVSTESGPIRLTKSDIGKAGVYILYGEKQYFSYSLKYNISNPNLFPVRTEIALPPKTNYQNVLINSYSEEPLNVTVDEDGNWIAEYRLLPQQKKIITVTGVVEVLQTSEKEELTNKQLKDYTSAKKYWDGQSSSIKQAAASLKTPEDIYEYVVKKLSYNYTKVATDNLRLGGAGALSDPKNSVCLEFSDLFISLARANGIPARSVEGFAYTQNSKLRPLSLVNDILHAWPEYYDTTQKRWVMVDPTWGNTTKGMDYFTSLDFSHVAFAIKGVDSEYPIPAGGYKFNQESKDVLVKFAQSSDFTVKDRLEITDTFPTFSFPKVGFQGTFTVKNAGNRKISDLVVNVSTSKGTSRQFLIDSLPPSGYKKITTSFNDVPFLTNGEYVITIQVGETKHKKSIRISFIPDLQILLFIGGLISGSIIIAAVTFHTGSILLQRRKRKNSVRR